MIPAAAVAAASDVFERLVGIRDEYAVKQILEAAAPQIRAREFSPTRWWRAVASDGSLLAETSSTDDFTVLDLIDNPGVTFHRLYEETPESEWREETP